MNARAALWTGTLLACTAALAIAARDLDVPGLYYDEVIQAEPAVQLVLPDGEPSRIPGATTVHVFGRWVPVMIQPYMGGLKSLLLAPGFAIFGATAATLRLSTLLAALAGLALFAAWARRVYSPPVAILSVAFLALDPTFLFVSRHDWGSIALGLVCRSGALLFLTEGFRRGNATRMALGGLFLGLGLYNKVDFAVFPAAAGLALAISYPRALAAVARAPRLALASAGGFVLGAAPLLVLLPSALSATQRVIAAQGRRGPSEWSEKWTLLTTTLDGSHFHRLMLSGGSFEDLAAVEGAATGLLLPVFIASAVFLAFRLARDANRVNLFALATALLSLVGILLLPRAVRVHHALNAWPFPQLVVACAVAELWRLGSDGPARVARVVAAGAAVALLAASLRVDLRTLETIRETGGRGRWSDAKARFASELLREPGAVVVSLDWGLHGPLRFAARDLQLEEPTWAMRRSRLGKNPWSYSGTPHHVYLVYDEPYAVYGWGPALLERVRGMPPERVTVRRHDDRAGEPAFYSIRFAEPHSLVYRGRGNPGEPAAPTAWGIAPR